MLTKKIAFFIIIIASIFIINNLVRSIYTLWQKKNLVVNAKQDVDREKAENEELKRKLAKVEKPEFVEEQARDKLFMSKPGEGVIVLSQKDLEATISAKPKPVDTRPNWKKWWDLFF
ncbi:MAG TPA: septum formation initiator family protein [Candidatus Saccharimonadales bacterium]|nr:septum formation initiator family protein [Candidatus Saccharimonadales bacterium]